MAKSQPTQKRKAPPGRGKAPGTAKPSSLRSLVFITFVGACMFVVGVLVGRGTAPVRFDIQALQKELTELRRQVVERERREAQIHRQPIEAKAELDFYEALKEEDAGEEVQLRPAPKPETEPAPAADPPQTAEAEPLPEPSPPPAAAEPKTAAEPEEKPASTKEPATPAAAGTAQANGRVSAPSDSETLLTVQVASMREWSDAADTVAQLKRRGFAAYLVEVRLPEKGTWYRVRVGAFPDKASAADTLDRLRGERLEGILVPRR